MKQYGPKVQKTACLSKCTNTTKTMGALLHGHPGRIYTFTRASGVYRHIGAKGWYIRQTIKGECAHIFHCR